MSIRILNGGTPTPFPSVLNAPTNVTAGTPTSTVIPLTWTPTEQGSAIEYLAKDNSTDITVATVNWPATGVNVTGLDADTEYSHYVVTSDGVKVSPKSNVATATTAIALPWKLAAGHYYDNQVIVPLKLINPLPDGGTGQEIVNTWARHRWAHSQFQYQYPIDVQGGAYPYKYELVGTAGVDYPTGMVIGETYGSAGYGILTWTPGSEAQNTQWTIQIIATDQEDRPVNTSWTLELDDDMFRFQDPAASSGATGTWADPYELFADWYGVNVAATAATQGKIMVYRDGTHVVTKASDLTNQISFFHGDTKPMSHIRVPGEFPTWDTSNCHVIACQGNDSSKNFYLAGIAFDGSIGNSIANNRIIYVSGSGDQFTSFGLSFSNMSRGSIGSDNECCIWLDTVFSRFRQHISIKNCTTNGLPASVDATNGFAFLDIYMCQYMLIDGCSDVNSSNRRWIWWKVSGQYTTTRNCTFRTNGSTDFGIVDHYNSVNYSRYAGNQEVCYNNLAPLDVSAQIAISANHRETGNVGPIAIFRNTVQGQTNLKDPARVGFTNADVIYLRNVHIDDLPINQYLVIPPGETNVYETSGAVDSAGLLTDAYIAAPNNVSERGTHGHEIA